MTTTNYGLAGGMLALFLMAGCQSMQVEEMPVEEGLPAAQKPAMPPVGTVIHGTRDGEAEQIELVAHEGNMLTFATADGCQSTRDASMDPIFSPSTSWTDCGGSSGKIDISSKDGDIWPMQVGSSVSFEATGTSSRSSNTWPADFSCEVVDQARITVAAGTFDTYKVDCSTPWRDKTMYYAPSVGVNVKSLQWRKNQSNASQYDWELVRVEQP